jgi:pimeloyl-ACP methyl ester carboxylesterase
MPTVSTARVPTAGLHLARYGWGGSGPPLLLAHATGFHGRVWEPLATRLVTAGFTVWSFDSRGHGDSDPSPDGYAWTRFADDVRAVLESLGLVGDPDLLAVGHSKGAAALLLAEVAAPGTIHRAWCYEPVVVPGAPNAPQPEVGLAAAARRRRRHWSTPDEAARSWARRPPLDALDPASLHAYVEHGLRPAAGGWELKCAPDDEAATYAEAPAHDLWDRLPEIGARVDVVCGERSDAVGPRLAGRLADRLANGTLEVLSGLGHFGPLEDPDAAAASILAFAHASARRGT